MAETGRPSIYTQELADRICELLSEGLSLRTVCKADDMPAMSSVFSWLRTKPDFLEQYARAKQESADAMAEELLYIADTPMEGEEVTVKADGSQEVKRGDMLGHRRLQVDSRKWLMAKMKPKKYGDQIDVTSDGKPLPVPIIPLNVQRDHSNQKDSVPNEED